MTEEFLQFIWKYGLFDRTSLLTDAGEEIQVISLGEQNQDSGPDFLNARIKIGPTTWAGNVEIHLRSADWDAHGHRTDRAYDNVILHVVYRYDQPVNRTGGEIIPTLVLPFSPLLYENYRQLMQQHGIMPCRMKINRVDPLLLDCWLSSLTVERLEKKAEHIAAYLRQSAGNWEEAFYVSLARSFGFGLNAAPFEWVAKSLPLTILSRHRNNLLQVEALLLGQAGMLEEGALFSAYQEMLRKEYLHLKLKYDLKPVGKHLWKFLRLRPVNFPAIRIAQFACLMQQSEGLFSQILSCREIPELRQFFTLRASVFWNSHYTFEKTSPARPKLLGETAFCSIVINTVIPFLFVYGSMNGRDEVRDKALDWLNRIPPESNRVVRGWNQAGIQSSSAFYSQALLQLTENYCRRRRCLACSVGAQLITAGIQIPIGRHEIG
jgi:hypothetical protein